MVLLRCTTWGRRRSRGCSAGPQDADLKTSRTHLPPHYDRDYKVGDPVFFRNDKATDSKQHKIVKTGILLSDSREVCTIEYGGESIRVSKLNVWNVPKTPMAEARLRELASPTDPDSTGPPQPKPVEHEPSSNDSPIAPPPDPEPHTPTAIWKGVDVPNSLKLAIEGEATTQFTSWQTSVRHLPTKEVTCSLPNVDRVQMSQKGQKLKKCR